MVISAVETRYAGCHFRSRLEARWAVFFDTFGIEWEYEPERYALPRTFEEDQRCIGRSYLPDFYLPATGTYVEVKGRIEALDWGLLLDLADGESPLPGMAHSYGTYRGLLLLGPVPRISPDEGWAHPILQHRKGVEIGHAYFAQKPGLCVSKSRQYCCQWDSFHGEGRAYGGPFINGFEPSLWEKEIPKDILFGHSQGSYSAWKEYNSARSARFEHGQEGAT